MELGAKRHGVDHERRVLRVERHDFDEPPSLVTADCQHSVFPNPRDAVRHSQSTQYLLARNAVLEGTIRDVHANTGRPLRQ